MIPPAKIRITRKFEDGSVETIVGLPRDIVEYEALRAAEGYVMVAAEEIAETARVLGRRREDGDGNN